MLGDRGGGGAVTGQEGQRGPGGVGKASEVRNAGRHESKLPLCGDTAKGRSFPPECFSPAEGRPPLRAHPGLEANVAERLCCGFWRFMEAGGSKGAKVQGGRVQESALGRGGTAQTHGSPWTPAATS